MVHVPKTSWPPPFRVTRASHLTYNVRDLSRSREFYTQVLGLVVSDEDRDTLYLRGVEERSHHSLVLKRTSAAPACIRTGLRTYDEEDLEKAKFFFASRGLPAEFVEAPMSSSGRGGTVLGTRIMSICLIPMVTVSSSSRRRFITEMAMTDRSSMI